MGTTPSGGHALIEAARVALQRLAAAPPATKAARMACLDLDDRWSREPLLAAVAGQETSTRTAFLNFLAGAELISEDRRLTDPPVITLARGPVTLCQVQWSDGVEQTVLADPETAEHVVTRDLDSERKVAALKADVAAARDKLPAALVAPAPPRSAVWRWILRWWIGLRHPAARRRLAAAEAALARARQNRLAAVASAEADPARHQEDPARHFAAEVRSFTNGGRRGDGVERICLELAEAPLPAGVAVIEVTMDRGALRLPPEVDGCLYVGTPERLESEPSDSLIPDDGGIEAPVFAVVAATASSSSLSSLGGSVALLPVGGFEQALAILPTLLEGQRALRLGRSAHQAVRSGIESIERTLAEAEHGFASRVSAIEAQGIGRPAYFLAQAFERARPLAIERVHAIIGQAAAELGAAIDARRDEWAGQLRAAASADELRSAARTIEAGVAGSLGASHKDLQRLISSALAGGAHDLMPGLVAELGPAGAVKSEPSVPPVAAVPSLIGSVELSLGVSRKGLVALFRSLEGQVAAAEKRLEERVGQLRNIALAELYDVEPALERSLLGALEVGVQGALDRQAAQIQRALSAERAAIARERATLAPLRALSERSEKDAAGLGRLLRRAAAALHPQPPE